MELAPSLTQVDGSHDLARIPWLQATAAVLVRPRLWTTALRQGRRIVVPGWWRRPPFVPRPDPEYLRFRLETQYGSGGRFDADDLVAYLVWCRAMERDTRID
ncbi:MAG: hypothetical protein JWL73_1768 [Actinomycetia bacterium]|nr:hypothetical protein [Actinomycetes bacterium]